MEKFATELEAVEVFNFYFERTKGLRHINYVHICKDCWNLGSHVVDMKVIDEGNAVNYEETTGPYSTLLWEQAWCPTCGYEETFYKNV